MAQMNGPMWSLTRREFGSRLQELRDIAGLTLVGVAQLLRDRGIKIDNSSLSRIENGKRGVSRETAEALLDCYQTDTATRDHILGLLSVDTTRRRRPALWRKYSAVIGSMKFEEFLTLERRASRMHSFQTALIPGLYQTPQYARLVLEGMRPDLTPVEIKGLVALRMSRQQELAKGPLRDFQALIAEGALSRTVGDQTVMRAQLERLLTASEEPPHTIRILPEVIAIHPGLAGPFVLMGFPESTPDVVCVETMSRSVYLEEEADVQRYTEVFAGLWKKALEPDATVIRLKEKIKELR
ncbi:helix-turn-helix domain-containing protein (plasmid) [Streptosporangium sp. CA-135522]|uniref:helix-turn-helix domain-containing protein n=1 Tax=Streptosporangium sp. CA-135522 TaxID=3240072 RepID=UPI003D8CD5B0